MIGKSNLWSWSCKCSRHRAITIKKKKKSSTQDCTAQSDHDYALEMHQLSSKGGFSSFLQSTYSGALQSLHLHKEPPQLIGAWKVETKWGCAYCTLSGTWNATGNGKFWLFAKREQTGRMITMQCSSYMCNHNKYDVYWKSKWRWLKIEEKLLLPSNIIHCA